MNNVLSVAEHYISSGLKCFPTRIEDKTPKVSAWSKEFLTFDGFLAKYKEGDGLGVLCGRASWLVCIDIDVRGIRNGMLWYEANKDRLGNPIVEYTGGGGLHLYYNYPKDIEYLPSSPTFADGVEIMAEGRYVVTAPSSHASGVNYRIHNELKLTDVPFEADELPDWIVQELIKKRHKDLEDPEYINGVDSDIFRAIETISRLPPAIQGQMGDQQTFAAAKECRKWGLSQLEAYELLSTQYNPRCVPPWSPSGLKRKILNAYTYHGGTPVGENVIKQGKPEDEFQDERIQEKSIYTKSNILDFIKKPYPPREHIIGPFVKQGLNMVYAPPGVGKTYFAMSLAFAIATKGRFLNWHCEVSQSVIYIDGELPAHLLQDRLKTLISQNYNQNITGYNFDIVTPDEQQSAMPDLSTKEGQEAALELIGDSQFIIVDNISTLCRTGKENEAESWIPVQNWLLKLRRMGKSVLLVHHSGKGEVLSPRGTSKREDTLDLVISLSHPTGYKHEDGCKFEVKFRKSRHFRPGDDIKEIIAQLNDFGWSIENLEQNNEASIEHMYSILGLSQVEIAKEIGVSQPYVSKIISKLCLIKGKKP